MDSLQVFQDQMDSYFNKDSSQNEEDSRESLSDDPFKYSEDNSYQDLTNDY